MSRSLNKIQLIGNIGSPPESKKDSSGKIIGATVSIATTEEWKDKVSGDKKSKTEWHRVVFWNKLAEIVCQYIDKGAFIYVEGKLTHRKYEKDGKEQYITEIVASELKMLGGKSEGYQKPDIEVNEYAQISNKSDFNDDIPF